MELLRDEQWEYYLVRLRYIVLNMKIAFGYLQGGKGLVGEHHLIFTLPHNGEDQDDFSGSVEDHMTG